MGGRRSVAGSIDRPIAGRPLTRRSLLFGSAAALALAGCRRRREPTPTPPPFIGADVAAHAIGQEVRVRMRIECTEVDPIRDAVYLKPNCYYEGFFFRLVIPPEQRDEFAEAVRGAPAVQLVDRVVDVTGVVQKHGVWSEIVLQAPGQLRIASGWTTGYVPTPVPTLPTTPAPQG